ncbi:MAG: tRNA preQ1(34) S-adenosylmethionine ribosyltransferase-isomerase QueA [Chitinivibrionales bacterium]|nr:tRNA preQ1(34) S-adenosylmethionine ribosyltransferase-isomerase QueA [Chitinivibrionales bacterium]MBD3358570.1 tRNA preQ1(34) S-adenosylmethionine ribosyltransferase-isomerase QueA [Chitinivibrionales bacterium]
MDLKTSDFHYDLPEELIAQQPLRNRDRSRLLVMNRGDGGVEHRCFADLPDLLCPGDRLVFNDTRVLPARLFCRKASGAAIEFLFLEPERGKRWRALAKPARRLRPGVEVTVEGNPSIGLRIEAASDDGTRVVAPIADKGRIEDILEQHGRIPLPPYIHREATNEDRDTYQTVYARTPGAVAAPTAGLHFTQPLLKRLQTKGVASSSVTLHVGVGTFRPVKEDDPRDHPIHEERYEVTEATAKEITQTRAAGGRIIAVGTTVVRTLEHCARRDGTIEPGKGVTRLMILPGYRFKVIDGLITNFHLPGSTLLMLVSALAGREHVLNAYGEAIHARYRFYSYGDAMAIF